MKRLLDKVMMIASSDNSKSIYFPCAVHDLVMVCLPTLLRIKLFILLLSLTGTDTAGLL